MEYLDLYDKNCKKIGKKILRGTEIPKNYYIMLSIIFIENSKGEFLFQMTSPIKGSIWATTGGHVQSGDNSIITIVKEVYEELGLKIAPSSLKHIYTGMKCNRILEAYYIKLNIDIDTLTLQKEEVEYVKWLTKNEIKNLILLDNVRKSNIDIMIESGIL